jgi:hypothetical protein
VEWGTSYFCMTAFLGALPIFSVEIMLSISEISLYIMVVSVGNGSVREISRRSSMDQIDIC